jgi:hypothetical protein
MLTLAVPNTIQNFFIVHCCFDKRKRRKVLENFILTKRMSQRLLRELKTTQSEVANDLFISPVEDDLYHWVAIIRGE